MASGSGITVVVRVRPLNEMENSRGDSADGVRCMGDRVVLAGQRQLTFDAAFGGPDQAQVFERTEMRALLDASLQGFAATVFAYGQTGSGKTYTMSGPEYGTELDASGAITSASEGIIPRAVRHLFAMLDSYTASRSGVSYAISASYLEIYNEQINDLLNTSSTGLPMRWHAAQGFFVEGLVVVDCETVDELMLVFQEGTKNRKACARANAHAPWLIHPLEANRASRSAGTSRRHPNLPLPPSPSSPRARRQPAPSVRARADGRPSGGLAPAQQGLVALALHHAGPGHLSRAGRARRPRRRLGRRAWQRSHC